MGIDIKMDDNTPPKKNPWSSLSTVTSFDRGNDTKTTVRLNNNEVQHNGQIVSMVTPSASLLIESLIQQLCTMFEGDSVRRNKLYYAICDRLHELKLIDGSYNMMEFETLRGQYQRALYHLVTVARASTGSESALQVPSCLMVETSRYQREFNEIGYIAGGGFGHVFKAQHRLDGIEYAVKKVIVRSGRVKSIMEHLEEVKTLAKLNHTNIVSYKGAWIEPTLSSTFVPSLPPTVYSSNRQNSLDRMRPSRSNSNSNQSSHSPIYSNTQDMSLSPNKRGSYRTGMYVHTNVTKRKTVYESAKGYIVSDDLINERFHQLNSPTNIIGQRITENDNSKGNHEDTNSNSVSFRNDSKDSKHEENATDNNANYSDGSDSLEESDSNKKICPYVSQVNHKFATLYIQMALCEKTLQQWLDERIDVTSPTMITAILTQILCGLDYIHSNGIVHHDIKPSNIFISTSGHLQIQLGDFGLACPLQRENHNSVVGTHMYAAPEQLQGKCDPKSDVYSVGIVLLELLVRTNTCMERIEIIKRLKNGHIPTALTATYPKWAYIVSQLVQEDPKKRPSTGQLLQDLNEDKDITIAQLKNDIVEKDSIIQKLRQRIVMLEEQVAELTVSIDSTKN